MSSEERPGGPNGSGANGLRRADAARRSVGDTGYVPRQRPGPRVLLQRLREIMALEMPAQARLGQLVQAIAANTVSDVCSLYVRRASGALELFATVGLNEEAVHETRMAPGEGLVGFIAQERRPLRVMDARKHPAFAYKAETGEDTMRAFLGVPIVRSGQVLGVLAVQNRTERPYTDDELEAMQTVATVFAEIVQAGEMLDRADTAEAQALLGASVEGHGAAVSGGIAVGQVALLVPDSQTHRVFAASVHEERERLGAALAALQAAVDEMIRGDRNVAGVDPEVLEVYRLFAYDRAWARRLEDKVLSGLTAETAVEQVQAENRTKMRAAPDPYLRERLHDLDDLSRRLIRKLSGEEGAIVLPEGAVLVAETLGPAELLELDHDKLVGLVLADGGGTSHAAIVARAMGLPFVSGVPVIVESAQAGDVIALDGDRGDVRLRPPDDVVRAFEEMATLRRRRLTAYRAHKDEPSVSKDGVRIDLAMNAGLMLDMPNLAESGASGVGLFRTELPFLIGRTLPTAADQEALYRDVLAAASGKPVIFRTADIGSDKRAAYMQQPVEANPAMGWRGLRVGLDRKGLLRTQLRALIAAASEQELSVMLPLVTTVSEVEAARVAVNKELDRADRRGAALPSRVRLGTMIEIPAAAWSARQIAKASDFVSIGGNDLAQFFFAADRDSDLVSSRYDPLSPGFLGFVARTIQEAKTTARPVSYCGEQASDPLMALALISLGLRSLSLTASAIAPIRAMIRSVDVAAISTWLRLKIDEEEPDLRGALAERAAEAGVELPSWT